MFRFKHILVLVACVVASALFVQPSNLISESLRAGEVSPKDIVATQSVTYADKAATDKLQKEALAKVQNAYDMDNAIAKKAQDSLNLFFSSIEETKKSLKAKTDAQKSSLVSPLPSLEEIEEPLLGAMANPYGLGKEDLRSFLEMDEESAKHVKNFSGRELDKIFASGVTEENSETLKKQFVDRIDLYYFPEFVGRALISKLAGEIKPNLLLNIDETEKRKREALSKVEQQNKAVKKGEVVVRFGEIATEDQIEKLQKLGLIQTGVRYAEILKQLPCIALLFALFHFYCFKFHARMFVSAKIYAFALSLVSVSFIAANFLKSALPLFSTFFFFAPFLTALFVIVVFFGRQFIVFSSVITALLLSVKIGNDLLFLILPLVAGVSIALRFNPSGKRFDLTKSGFVVGLISFVANLAFSGALDSEFDYGGSWQLLLASVAASIVTIGLLPIIENSLGLVTSVRLHELVEPDSLLLKRLMTETPGTYQHSVMVGNLAVAAAEKIGANGLLLRAGAFYHDVGKLLRPDYFIENVQPGWRNPHDALTPLESAEIILRHPLDSVQLCKEHKLPEPIVQLIASHHGDSVMHHFYEKAKKAGLECQKSDFQYKTPAPKTKEEGILLLADGTEAFSRTLVGKTKEELETAIRSLVMEKVRHGDLRRCALTFNDLELAIEAFCECLVGTTHRRISYKEDNEAENLSAEL